VRAHDQPRPRLFQTGEIEKIVVLPEIAGLRVVLAVHILNACRPQDDDALPDTGQKPLATLLEQVDWHGARRRSHLRFRPAEPAGNHHRQN
jgi:hypothetical protein